MKLMIRHICVHNKLECREGNAQSPVSVKSASRRILLMYCIVYIYRLCTFSCYDPGCARAQKPRVTRKTKSKATCASTEKNAQRCDIKKKIKNKCLIRSSYYISASRASRVCLVHARGQHRSLEIAVEISVQSQNFCDTTAHPPATVARASIACVRSRIAKFCD